MFIVKWLSLLWTLFTKQLLKQKIKYRYLQINQNILIIIYVK